MKMRKTLLIGSAVIICGSFLIVVGLIYLISPRTVNATVFIGQGWCCHYLASAFRSANLDAHFEQFQQCSIDGYEKARHNLESEQLLALKEDEEQILAYHYVNKADYKAALPLLEHIEAESRKQLRLKFPDRDSWVRNLAGLLQTHASVLAAENKPRLALAKYEESFATYEELVRSGTLDEVAKKYWSTGKSEAERLRKEIEQKPKLPN